MRRTLIILFIIPLVILATKEKLKTNVTGSPAGYTGAPGDPGNCTASACHDDATADFTGSNSQITTNIPAGGYEPNETYQIIVQVSETGRLKFGFEAVVLGEVSGDSEGNLIITNGNETQFAEPTGEQEPPAGREYMTHTDLSTTATDSKSWSFDWRAPSGGRGDITIYAAFNAANGTGGRRGDQIYLDQLTIPEASSNNAPSIQSVSNQTMNEGELISVNVSASDPDGNDLVLTVQNLPDFADFSDNGNGTADIDFSPGFDDAGTYPNIIVTASDNGTPTLSSSISFTLTVQNVNRAPRLEAIANQSVTEGQTLQVQISASDDDGDALQLSVSNLPGFGRLIDNGDGSGMITFAPDFQDAGTYNDITVVVSDSGQPVVMSQTVFNLEVMDETNPPKSLSIVRQSEPAPGETFEIEVVVTGAADLFGISFEIVYSPSAMLTPLSVQPGDFLGTSKIFIDSVDVSAGSIGFGITKTAAGQNDDQGTIVRVELQLSASSPAGQRLDFGLRDVVAVDANGQFLQFQILDPVTGVGEPPNTPSGFTLAQNYPNPFNPETFIPYSIEHAGNVELSIYDLLGRKVRSLVKTNLPAGSYRVRWDGRLDNGQLATSGVYIYQLKSAALSLSKKLLLLR